MSRHLEHDWYPHPLPDNVVIGERSWCHSSFAFVHYRSRRGVQIGRDTGIYKGTQFDLGVDGEVVIGDFCTLVGAILSTNRKIEIGDYALISHEVVFADDHAAVPAPATPPGPGIVVGRNAWIGARAIVLAGAVIGEGAVIGAGSVVTGHVPPFTIAAGNPLRIVKTIQPGTSLAGGCPQPPRRDAGDNGG